MNLGGAIRRAWRVLALTEAITITGSLVAADYPDNNRSADAMILGGTYFELRAAQKTNDLGVLDSSVPADYWWKWTAPKDGRLSLRQKAQTPFREPSLQTFVEAWPEPTYDATNGWPADSVITLQSVFTFDLFFAERHTPLSNFPALIGVSPTGRFEVFEDTNAGNLVSLADWLLPIESALFQGGVKNLFVQEGHTYFLHASVERASELITVLFTPTPMNDQFATRTALSGVDLKVEGNNFAASFKTNQPLVKADALGQTIWWSWTPSIDGNLFLTFDGPSTAMAVFRGESLDALEQVSLECVTSPSPTTLRSAYVSVTNMLVRAKAGKPLNFAVDATGWASDYNFAFRLFLEPLPPAIDAQKSRRLDDGSFFFKAEQLRGRDVTVYSSWDLVNWKAIWRGIVNGEGVSFRDMDAKWADRSFYSIRLTPSEYLQIPSEGPIEEP